MLVLQWPPPTVFTKGRIHYWHLHATWNESWSTIIEWHLILLLLLLEIGSHLRQLNFESLIYIFKFKFEFLN